MSKKIKPFQKGDLVLYFDPFDNYKKYPAVIKKIKRTRAEIKVQVKMLTWETWDVPCEDLKHTWTNFGWSRLPLFGRKTNKGEKYD